MSTLPKHISFFDQSNKKFSFPMKTKTGNTTRTIDRCVQELFTNKVTYVYDGRGKPEQAELTKKAFGIFIERLEREHPKAKYVSRFGNYDGIECFKVETHNL